MLLSDLGMDGTGSKWSDVSGSDLIKIGLKYPITGFDSGCDGDWRGGAEPTGSGISWGGISGVWVTGFLWKVTKKSCVDSFFSRESFSHEGCGLSSVVLVEEDV